MPRKQEKYRAEVAKRPHRVTPKPGEERKTHRMVGGRLVTTTITGKPAGAKSGHRTPIAEKRKMSPGPPKKPFKGAVMPDQPYSPYLPGHEPGTKPEPAGGDWYIRKLQRKKK